MEVTVKKLFILTLCAIMTALSLSACEKPSDPTPSPAAVATADSLTKIKQDETYRLDATSAHIEAAKDEYESFQIIVSAGDNDIANVGIEISAPKNGSAEIPKENINIYWEKYVNVSVPTSIYLPGYYPDALLPFEKAKEYKENNIKENANQGIWVEIHVPRDAAAGTYSGSAEIKLDEKTVSVPYSVTVFDFALPEETHAQTAYGLWYYQLVNDAGFSNADNGLHDELTLQLKENYYNDLSEYRISSMIFPTENAGSATDFAADAQKYASSNKITNFQIPTQTQTATSEFIPEPHTTINYASTAEYIKALAQASTNENNLVAKAYFYVANLIDEPSGDKYDLVKEIDDIIARAKREVADSDIFAGKEEVREAVLNIPHLVTGKLENGLKGYVDTFCSTTEYYASASYRHAMQEQQKQGTGAWWYTAVKPKAPMPSYHIDATLSEHRILGWQSMEKNIEGNLYWSASVFYKHNYSAGVYESRDVWNDPYAFPGAAGDGFLIYPGAKYGIDSFIPTLRLQAIRDGFEDYEYLWLLEQIIGEVNEKYGTNIDFYAYVNDLSRQLYNGLIPNSDAAVFQQMRHILASILETYYTAGVFADIQADYAKNSAVIDFYGKNDTVIGTEDGKSLKIAGGKASYTYEFSQKNTAAFTVKNAELRLLVPRTSSVCVDFKKNDALDKISSSKPAGETVYDCVYEIGTDHPLAQTALKATITPNANARPDHTYYIRFTDLGITDFTQAEDVVFTVYNDEDYAFVIKPKLRTAQKAKTLDDVVLAPNSATQVKIKLKSYEDFEINKLTAIDIAFDIFGMESTPKTIYISNIFITQK
ncbi:MAG: hypothetical protein DBX59_10590 [Bacillota bacterium]|nr:MAG: hypothetical protein DBX59_10590 [Bacillota bacterium]